MSDDYEETYFDEPAPAPRRPAGSQRQRPSIGANNRLPWLITAVVAVVAIVLVVYFAAIRNTSSTKTSTGPTSTTGQSAGRYSVGYPKSWAAVDPNTVAPGQHAFAAFRQRTGKGVVVMRLEQKVTLSTRYIANLKAQLQRTVPDFRFLSSHGLTLQGRPALDFTYERTSLQEVRNVVVLPAGNVTVVMATIAPIGSSIITRQINDIVSSFKLTS